MTYIDRNESATELRSAPPRKNAKPESPRLAMRECAFVLAADVILSIRKEGATDGEGKGEDGRGACGGSRYVEVVCGVSNPVAGEWRIPAPLGTF